MKIQSLQDLVFHFYGVSAWTTADAFCERNSVNNTEKYNTIELITISVRNLIARDIVLAICVVLHRIWNVSGCSERRILYTQHTQYRSRDRSRYVNMQYRQAWQKPRPQPLTSRNSKQPYVLFLYTFAVVPQKIFQCLRLTIFF